MLRSARIRGCSGLLVALAVAGALGCGEPDDSGRVSTDCFSASPQNRPTRAEVQEFAALELPPAARVLRTRCEGFMDTYLEASLTLPATAVDAFLRGSGFTPLAKGETDAVRDRPRGAVQRRIRIRITGAVARIELTAFDT